MIVSHNYRYQLHEFQRLNKATISVRKWLRQKFVEVGNYVRNLDRLIVLMSDNRKSFNSCSCLLGPFCPCGQYSSTINTRVVGGHPVGRNGFPYAVSLFAFCFLIA